MLLEALWKPSRGPEVVPECWHFPTEPPPAPPVVQVLSQRYTVLDWDSAAVTDVVNRLTPRNCQVMMVMTR